MKSSASEIAEKLELVLFLNQNEIDILLSSETHFTSKTTSTFPGMTFATPVTRMERHCWEIVMNKGKFDSRAKQTLETL